MLEEHEWDRLSPALTNPIQSIRELKGCDLATAQVLAGEDACDLFYEITGFRVTNFNALYHHRLAKYGPECPKCGHLFRTPLAKVCANCGLRKDELTNIGR